MLSTGSPSWGNMRFPHRILRFVPEFLPPWPTCSGQFLFWRWLSELKNDPLMTTTPMFPLRLLPMSICTLRLFVRLHSAPVNR